MQLHKYQMFIDLIAIYELYFDKNVTDESYHVDKTHVWRTKL